MSNPVVAHPEISAFEPTLSDEDSPTATSQAEVAASPVMATSACMHICKMHDIPANLPDFFADVGDWAMQAQCPVVYCPSYNISFLGTELLSSWDAHKFKKVQIFLIQKALVHENQFVAPIEATDDTFRDVHDEKYMTELTTTNWKILQVSETPSLLLMPRALLRWRILRPLRYHAAGTMLAAGLALQYGWGINLGGGMHHAYHSDGRGWCAFDDIMLAIRRVRVATGGRVQRVLLVDLDAHQGNGVQRDKLHFQDEDLRIIDLYNPDAFPRDEEAKAAIDVDVPLPAWVDDDCYVAALSSALLQVRHRGWQVDMVFFNAGVDVLKDEGCGRLGLTPQGVVARDEMVWDFAAELGVPICMTLGGGYGPGAVGAICLSLANLFAKFKLNTATLQ